VAPRPAPASAEPRQSPAQTATPPAPEWTQTVSPREDPGPPEAVAQAFETPVGHSVELPPQKASEPALVGLPAVAAATEAALPQREALVPTTADADLGGGNGPAGVVQHEPDRRAESVDDGDATPGETALEYDPELFDVATPSEDHAVEVAA